MSRNVSSKLAGERRPTSINLTTTSLATFKMVSSETGLGMGGWAGSTDFFGIIKTKAPAAKEGQFLSKSAEADLVEKNRSGPPRKDFYVKLVELSGIEPLTS
jgi:hypothetical protein